MAKAKKVRRVRQQKQNVAAKSSETQKSTTPRKPSSNRRTGQAADPTQQWSATEQTQLEYAYHLRDLRLVFILAGIMFALLIILNLVLR